MNSTAQIEPKTQSTSPTMILDEATGASSAIGPISPDLDPKAAEIAALTDFIEDQDRMSPGPQDVGGETAPTLLEDDGDDVVKLERSKKRMRLATAVACLWPELWKRGSILPEHARAGDRFSNDDVQECNLDLMHALTSDDDGVAANAETFLVAQQIYETAVTLIRVNTQLHLLLNGNLQTRAAQIEQLDRMRARLVAGMAGLIRLRNELRHPGSVGGNRVTVQNAAQNQAVETNVSGQPTRGTK